jgi:hypothetical protein
MSNPYAPRLFELAEKSLALTSAEILAAPNTLKPLAHAPGPAHSAMTCAELANHLVLVAYAFADAASPRRGDPRALAWIAGVTRELFGLAPQGCWEAKPGGNGDLFTLLPMMEAFMLARGALPAPDRDDFARRFAATLDLLHEHFGRVRVGLHHPQYPNIEVNYGLCMHYGHVLTGKALFAQECERFVQRLARAQFADGGWTYIWDTAECPHYHGHIATVLSRLATVSGHPSAWAQIVKSIPYYPRVVSRNGVAEGWSDCWWKHVWNKQSSAGPDAVASLTRDGRNRWIGDLGRRNTLDEMSGAVGITNCNALFAVYSSLAWQDVPPVAPPPVEVLYDGNIRGPRGAFPEWSWGACSRYGNDTVVGAVAHGVEPISAVGGVIAQIPYWRVGETPETDNSRARMHLSVLPKGALGRTEIEGERARFRVAYPMANACCVWQLEECFPYAWVCRQDWTLERRALRGRMEMESLEDQVSRPPMLRIRFVRDGRMEDRGNGVFAYDPFVVRILRSDLPHHRLVEVMTTPGLAKTNAMEVQLLADLNLDERAVAAGRTFAVEMDIALERVAEY